jgi:carbon-monoxide dehydrogenase medium subunit
MKNFMPNSLSELYSDLANLTPASKVIGGGTDLVMHLNAGRVEPDALLYLENIEETRTIKMDGDTLVIGAGVTMNEMVNSELLKGKFQSIIDAAGDVGSEQIRNSGTIGGNIANASPAGDLIPIMFMIDAVLVIASSEGALKEVAIKDFIVGPGKTTLGHNEVIIAVRLAVPKSDKYISRFVKLGSRKKVTISRICVSMGLEIEDEVIKSASVYVGSISILPIKLEDAEKIMIGKKIDHELKMAVAKVLSDKIMEVTPEKFDRDYKVWASKGVIADVLECFQ